MRTGVGPGGVNSLVLYSVCVNMTTPSLHVELMLYADDTAIIASLRKPTLLVSYLDFFSANCKGG
jgi:hypothetical protein